MARCLVCGWHSTGSGSRISTILVGGVLIGSVPSGANISPPANIHGLRLTPQKMPVSMFLLDLSDLGEAAAMPQECVPAPSDLELMGGVTPYRQRIHGVLWFRIFGNRWRLSSNQTGLGSGTDGSVKERAVGNKNVNSSVEPWKRNFPYEGRPKSICSSKTSPPVTEVPEHFPLELQRQRRIMP
uniref:Uncharacterized protein n=1 Tax=Sphaerodactylus townsendi TaxID=933632 RepID=A0ACB8G7Y0_9SAUR